MTRLAICLPQTENVRAEYTRSLALMTLRLGILNEGIDDVQILTGSSSILPKLRQFLAERAIEKHEATHLLWIDADHAFPSDTAHRLLAHGRPYVGINATTRAAPIKPTALKGPGKPLETVRHSKGLERVWRMGFGIVLIETRVFQSMPKPWFLLEYFEKDGEPGYLGADVYFCEKAKQYGFQPMVDHDLTKETDHIGSMGFNSAILEEASKQTTLEW